MEARVRVVKNTQLQVTMVKGSCSGVEKVTFSSQGLLTSISSPPEDCRSRVYVLKICC